MHRVLLHAGFHKTGTSTVQDCLRRNRDALAPYASIHLLADFPALARITRLSARFPGVVSLGAFRTAFRRFLAAVRAEAARSGVSASVISWEGFSGYVPGFRGIRDYATAEVLAGQMVRAAGPETDLTLFYTTRDTDGWLSSAWRHHIVRNPLKDDFEAFGARLSDGFDLSRTVARIAEQTGEVPVIDVPLGDYRDHALGPAAALLDLLDVPDAMRANLRPATHRNASLPEPELAEMLARNRAEGASRRLKREKRARFRALERQAMTAHRRRQ